MENARNWGNGYPSAVPSNFSPSKDVTVTVKSHSPTAYCVQAVNTSINNTLYHITNNGTTPLPGGC